MSITGMKATGIVRKIDELGRIVIPMELRRTLELHEGDGMEIFTYGEQIIIRKYRPGCALCGNGDLKVVGINGKSICRSCTDQIVRTANTSLSGAGSGR